MNEFIEENKKMLILAVVLIGLCILFGIINMFMGTSNSKVTPEKALKELGSIYYEELLYPSIKENEYIYKNMIDDYKETGIQVSLVKLLDSI